MKKERNPTTYLTPDELRQIASGKLEEALAHSLGLQKEELPKPAENLHHLAEIKGRLPSEWRPPK